MPPFHTLLLIVNNGVVITTAKTPIVSKNVNQENNFPAFCINNRLINVIPTTPAIPTSAPYRYSVPKGIEISPASSANEVQNAEITKYLANFLFCTKDSVTSIS
jgi:hypothetical protein